MRTYRTQVIFYDFPHITHINDVLPHIEGKDEFRVMEKDWYTVINYAVAFEETFKWDANDPVGSAVRRECRGLIFNTETGNLISHPYHKFFNVGEKEETQLNKINLYEPHIVLEKLDGSMIRPIPTPEGFRLGTKAGITDVAMNAEVFVADKPHYARFIHKCLLMNVTPLFEWCSHKNRVVIDYPEDNLILTGMRYNDTGFYLDYEVMKNYADAWSIPVVQAVDGLAVQNIELFVKQVREWEDDEGVVVRFDTGHMCKVKSADYVLRHKSKDSISQEKNVIDCILGDAVDDLVPLLAPDDADRLQRFQGAFWAGLDEVAYEMAELFVKGNKMYPEKKDFAVEFVQKEVEPIYAPIMYAMKAGKGSQEVLIDMIRKSLSTQSKIQDARWMWGNLDWNHIDNQEQ
jgi:RNA ligase